jgi:hypothetical protein
MLFKAMQREETMPESDSAKLDFTADYSRVPLDMLSS